MSQTQQKRDEIARATISQRREKEREREGGRKRERETSGLVTKNAHDSGTHTVTRSSVAANIRGGQQMAEG
jgi:hypothetical protein